MIHWNMAGFSYGDKEACEQRPTGDDGDTVGQNSGSLFGKLLHLFDIRLMY